MWHTNNQSSKPMRNRRVYQTQNISYTDLLNRAYSRLHPNQSLNDGRKQKQSIPAPIVGFLPRKTIWTNFQQICNALRRSPNHLKKFFETELVTFCNFDAARHLILRGRWPNSHIQSTLKRYITQFVQCEDCSSLNTRMSRNNKQRLYELTCNECTAHRNCQKIEKAFKTIANRRQRIQQRQANMLWWIICFHFCLCAMCVFLSSDGRWVFVMLIVQTKLRFISLYLPRFILLLIYGHATTSAKFSGSSSSVNTSIILV